VSGFGVAHVDDLDRIPFFEGIVWRPVRRHFDLRAFGVNAYSTEEAGRHVIEEHDELAGGAGGHQELYVVLRGHATFTIDGAAIDAPAGTLVAIRDPALKRSAIAEDDDTLVLAVGAQPGVPYTPSAWEWYFGAMPLLKAGRWEEAIDAIAPGLEEHPGHPSILYNLACAESLAGRTAAALAHLNVSLVANSNYAERAKVDPDFDPIRGEAGFPA
jgi:tetratricopeptide (TPR) repeat protein